MLKPLTLLAFVIATPSFSDTVQYSDLDMFLADQGGASNFILSNGTGNIETFDGAENPTFTGIGSGTDRLILDDFSITSTIELSSANFGRRASVTGGTLFAEIFPTELVELSFLQPITSFGFEALSPTASPFPDLALIVSRSVGFPEFFPLDLEISDFFGIVSDDPFTRVTFFPTRGGRLTIDNVLYNTREEAAPNSIALATAPLPNAMILLLASVASLGILRLRSASNTA